MDPAPADLVLGAWAEQWLATAVHLKPKTVAGYQSLLRSRILPAFGAFTLDGIRPSDVRRWLAAMRADGLSASRCRQAVHLLGAVLQTAVDDGLLVSSPCAGVRLPPLPLGEMAFLTPDQLRRLLAAVRPDYRTLVALLAFGGLRFGEAAALRRGRCQLDRSRVVVAESLADVSGVLHCTGEVVHDPTARSVLGLGGSESGGQFDAEDLSFVPVPDGVAVVDHHFEVIEGRGSRRAGRLQIVDQPDT